MTIEEFLARLENVRSAGEGAWARDARPTTHKRQGLEHRPRRGGRILSGRLRRVHAGRCSRRARTDQEGPARATASGHAYAQDRARTYDYRDEAGVLLYQVVRFAPQDIRQRPPTAPAGNGDSTACGACSTGFRKCLRPQRVTRRSTSARAKRTSRPSSAPDASRLATQGAPASGGRSIATRCAALT